jgi:hypothetical protein
MSIMNCVYEKNDVKMFTLQKVTYRFNTIPIKIPMLFFIEIEIPILKLKWDHKGPQIAKVILFKKRNTWDITLSDFGLFYN